jgi:hypothetical protein
MRKTYLYITLIASIFPILSISSPRLTVVAVVDGLTTENLTMLRPYWQQGGLRTLSEEAFQTSVYYPHLVYGGNETTATLLTGESPDRHGYTMDQYFQRRDRHLHDMLEDESVQGIGFKQHISPRALLSPTLTDKMRLQHPNAKIYAVGIHPVTTVLLAGHSANACCWLDAEQKQWVTTAAYSEGLPSVAYSQNQSGRINTLSARIWLPRMDIPAYNAPTQEERKKGFSYDVANVLPRSPEANTLVIELALALQQAEKLGTDATPDLLMLQLNTLSPSAHSDRIASAEHEDMYLRLNQDLGFLMEQLDRRIGKPNYQILIIGRPILGTDEQTLADIHMPVQQFAEQPAMQGAFQSVVSNPPFFENALRAPERARNMARHTDALPFGQLFASVRIVMAKEGEFSVIIPFDYRQRLETEASLCGFFISRVCAVRTTPTKQPKRYMLAFRLSPPEKVEQEEGLLETSPGVRSPWYQSLTRDFYL